MLVLLAPAGDMVVREALVSSARALDVVAAEDHGHCDKDEPVRQGRRYEPHGQDVPHTGQHHVRHRSGTYAERQPVVMPLSRKARIFLSRLGHGYLFLLVYLICARRDACSANTITEMNIDAMMTAAPGMAAHGGHIMKSAVISPVNDVRMPPNITSCALPSVKRMARIRLVLTISSS